MSAIDFSEFGTITHHPQWESRPDDCYEVIQFHPFNPEDLREMLTLLDLWLAEHDRERSILISHSKRYPTPCVILHS